MSIPQRDGGFIQSHLKSHLGFEVSGLLADVAVDQGEKVSKNQIIARLDTALLPQQIEQAVAILEEIEARIKLARLNVERSERLERQKLLSIQTRDEAEAELAAREAQYRAQQARVAELKILFNKNIIRSPYAGAITALYGDVGQVVNLGQAIVTLESIEKPEVQIGLPAAVLAQFDTAKTYEFLFSKQTITGKWRTTLPKTTDQQLQTAILPWIALNHYQVRPWFICNLRKKFLNPIFNFQSTWLYHSRSNIANIIRCYLRADSSFTK